MTDVQEDAERARQRLREMGFGHVQIDCPAVKEIDDQPDIFVHWQVPLAEDVCDPQLIVSEAERVCEILDHALAGYRSEPGCVVETAGGVQVSVSFDRE